MPTSHLVLPHSWLLKASDINFLLFFCLLTADVSRSFSGRFHSFFSIFIYTFTFSCLIPHPPQIYSATSYPLSSPWQEPQSLTHLDQALSPVPDRDPATKPVQYNQAACPSQHCNWSHLFHSNTYHLLFHQPHISP